MSRLSAAADLLPPPGSLQRVANALYQADSEPLPALGVFSRVPDGCDVVSIRGHVAIVERAEITTDQLIEGGLYVYERQYRVASNPAPDARRDCERLVVRIYRDERVKGCWRYRNLDQPHRPGEGPIHDFGLASMLIGRVIGVYHSTGAAK